MGKVLVTGATGFLGGALVRNLVADRADVVATGRNKELLSLLPLPASATVAVDLANEAALRGCKDRFQGVTAIVHCAALSSPWGTPKAFHQANVVATENILALCKTLGVRRLIHISSPTLYFRFADQLDVCENLRLPRPVNAYAATKAIAEDKVRASDIPAIILRPRGIYGAGDAALLPRLLRAASTGPMPLFRQGRARTDITHVSDVVAAIRAALQLKEFPPERIFNISGGMPLVIKDVVDQVCALHSVPVRWKTLPLWPSLAAVRIGECIAKVRPGQPEPKVTAYGVGIFAFSQTLDLSAACEVLGWAPKMSFADGLAETFGPKVA